MALEKIHSNAGHSQPIGGAPAENKPLDGMDPVSSALLMVTLKDCLLSFCYARESMMAY